MSAPECIVIFMSKTKGACAQLLADQIEAEMRRLKLWSTSPPPAAQPMGAFGSPSMTFEEWLQFVFLPNLRRAGSTNSLPENSNVGTAAMRNLDGLEDIDQLLALLHAVDRLVNEG